MWTTPHSASSELTGGRIRLRPDVVTPPLGGAVGSEPAKMFVASCDGDELTGGRIQLPFAVTAPALGGTIEGDPARMKPVS